MDTALAMAVLALVVLSVAVMTRSSAPTWWIWPWGRMPWFVWVILGVVFALMMTLY
jgi:hypothetical protein